MLTTVKVNPKGQITIPAHIRKQLHLDNGDELELLVQDERLILARQETHIEDAFGLCKAHITVSLDDMEQAIQTRGSR